ncbi:MAG TPA: flavin reductase family protein [Abditibacteriaceae bacterium]|jgi:flavin reductase (DIM6/NTAB) family NADH-FMN oxidoreductase RutF
MQFDMAQLAPRDRYKLLVSTVVPRPIALVTSVDEAGRVNAAPFSFFNVLGSDPPLLVLGIGDRSRDTPKDSAHNIRCSGEFVVNLVDESIAESMNICAVDFPPEISEIEAAGLSTQVSVQVKVPRIAQSPVSFECREVQTMEIGRNRVIFGEVLQMHIRDDLVDAEKLYVHTENLRAVGRMHGAGWYTHTTEIFQIPRLSYEEWLERHGTDS